MPSKLLPVVVVALLAGCGHKGPLYLPGQKPPSGKSAPAPQTPPAATQPADTTKSQP